MYHNTTKQNLSDKINRKRNNTKKEVAISEEMEEQFIKVICDTLKKCICVYKPRENFKNFLLFNAYDKEYMTIGCIDGDNYLLDSNFIYKRLYLLWEQSHKGVGILPKLSDFFGGLYDRDMLTQGHFFDKPLYKFLIGDDGVEREYFFIPKSYVGYDDSIIKYV